MRPANFRLGTGFWLVTLGAGAAIDLAVGRRASLTVILVFAPFVASVFRSVAETAIATLSAIIVAVALGVSGDAAVTSSHLIRTAAVTAGGGLAIWLAIARSRREARLRAVARVAEIAQQAILRAVPPLTNHVALACAYRSATTEARIGGDFYDVVDSRWGTRILLGDVRGKGLDAVRLAAALVGEFRSRARTEPTLADVVEHVESTAEEVVDVEEFATAIVLEVRRGEAEVIRCGHPHPLIATPDGAVAELTTPGTLPLALGADGKSSTIVALPAGSRVLLFSDGAIETRDRTGVEFDLRRAFAAVAATPACAALEELLERLARHGNGHIDDDVVLLLAERTTSPTESAPVE